MPAQPIGSLLQSRSMPDEIAALCREVFELREQVAHLQSVEAKRLREPQRWSFRRGDYSRTKQERLTAPY